MNIKLLPLILLLGVAGCTVDKTDENYSITFLAVTPKHAAVATALCLRNGGYKFIEVPYGHYYPNKNIAYSSVTVECNNGARFTKQIESQLGADSEIPPLPKLY